MRIKNSSAEGEEPYNLVPLTDMVFNLLIFFMCATTFAQIEKDASVQLPRIAQSNAETASANPHQLIVNIQRDGELKIDGKAITARALRDLVATKVKLDPSGEVLIRADKNSRFDAFNTVTDACRQAGLPAVKYSCIGEAPATP